MSQEYPPFARGLLDRDVPTRESEDRLRAAWREPGATVLRVRGREVPVAELDGTLMLRLDPTAGELPEFTEQRLGASYLGRWRGAPVFGIPAHNDEHDAHDAAADGADSSDSNDQDADAAPEWRQVFDVAAELSEAEQELIAVASALIRWHESAAFSERDGLTSTAAHGGWMRLDAGGAELFPRTDPAVIVLVEHEDRVLLGSNALWPIGRFSLLAGFVEAGESLEQTVMREVFEESGVRVSEVQYVTSQPWPFPRSLMLGFRARLAPGQDPDALRPDTSEISELRWFTRSEIVHPPAGITLPGGASVARWLLDRWVAEGERKA